MLRKNFLQIPLDIQEQQSKFWFGIYEYIDFNELQKTIIRDYAEIIVRFDTLFMVASLVWAMLGGLRWFLIVISILYFLIFIYLLIKLIKRIPLFVALNRIIVTDKWIIAWNTVFDYTEQYFLDYLKIFEREFDEFLFKPSRLDDILRNYKNEIYDSMRRKLNMLDLWTHILSRDFRVVAFFWFFMLLYSISVIFFYYLGYVFVYIFGHILIFFVKIYLVLSGNLEFKIYQKVLDIYENLSRLLLLNNLINAKLDSFKGWQISDLWSFVEKKFKSFYSIILGVFNQTKDLYSMMEKSKYKDYINFDRMKNFIKEKYNEPVEWMMEILKKYRNLLVKQIEEIDELLKKEEKSEYIWNLKMKKLTLEKQVELMEENMNSLEKMKL